MTPIFPRGRSRGTGDPSPATRHGQLCATRARRRPELDDPGAAPCPGALLVRVPGKRSCRPATEAHIAGTRAGADRALVTECHPALGPICADRRLGAVPNTTRSLCLWAPNSPFCVGARWSRCRPAKSRSRPSAPVFAGGASVARRSTRSTRAASLSCPSNRSDATPGAPRSRTGPARATPPWRLRGHQGTT